MAGSTEIYWMLLLFVAVCFAVAGLGSRIGDRGAGSAVWFASLNKPPGYPGEWIFAPVWTLVSICTGIAGWLIWQYWLAGGPATALVLYGFQLGFQAIWQGLSIGLRRLGQGLALGFLAWGTITLTAIEAIPAAGWAWVWLVPAWLWVGYGVALNLSLWRLNRGL